MGSWVALEAKAKTIGQSIAPCWHTSTSSMAHFGATGSSGETEIERLYDRQKEGKPSIEGWEGDGSLWSRSIEERLLREG